MTIILAIDFMYTWYETAFLFLVNQQQTKPKKTLFLVVVVVMVVVVVVVVVCFVCIGGVGWSL